MDLAEQQRRIDAVSWYHEFEFPNGLRARSNAADVAFHRRVWAYIGRGLDAIDFHGKSVLEIGCWDGYWSFEAERRGARSVLATDDHTQNWAQSAGLELARDLLGSSIETKVDVSVYDLGALEERYDIILCLGVYYHLVDPFHAFAQIRHRAHADSIVVFEGDVTLGMRANTAQIDFSDHRFGVFVPTPGALDQLLRAAYFRVESRALMHRSRLGGWGDRARRALDAGRGRPPFLPPRINRALTVCRPFAGVNPLHPYAPPFGLDAYDDRFSDATRRSRSV